MAEESVYKYTSVYKYIYTIYIRLHINIYTQCIYMFMYIVRQESGYIYLYTVRHGRGVGAVRHGRGVGGGA